MKDKTLLTICLLISIFGLITMSVGVHLSEEKIIEINKIKDGDRGKIVKIKGQIEEKFRTEGGHIFLDVVDQTDNIKVVIFKNDYKNMDINTKNLNEGTKITTSGKVKKYEGSLEIIARRLEVL